MPRKRPRLAQEPSPDTSLDTSSPPSVDAVRPAKRPSPRMRNRERTNAALRIDAERQAILARGEPLPPALERPSLTQALVASSHYVPYDPQLASTAGSYPHKGKAGRPPAESSQAAYGFALYAALAPGERSYQAVLDILVQEGRNSPNSLPLVARWGARWNWNERAKLHDAQIIEENRARWEIERISMHREIADSSAKVYHEVVKLLEQRAHDGKLGNDAAVQLLRVAADLRHRSYQELTVKQGEEGKRGIAITIETRVESEDARARFASANPQVYELGVTARDPDDADTPLTSRRGSASRTRLLAPHIVEEVDAVDAVVDADTVNADASADASTAASAGDGAGGGDGDDEDA